MIVEKGPDGSYTNCKHSLSHLQPTDCIKMHMNITSVNVVLSSGEPPLPVRHAGTISVFQET